MKASKLKGLRIEMGFTQSDMAAIIEKSTDTYAKKERGEVMFTPSEMCLLATALKMTFAVFNYIFFDNNLPFGNTQADCFPSSNIIAEAGGE